MPSLPQAACAPPGDGEGRDARSGPQDLQSLPNIGPALALRLRAIGVCSPRALGDLGAVGAVRALSTPEDPACYNTLYALAGAIAGVRWHDLPESVRRQLRDELWADRP